MVCRSQSVFDRSYSIARLYNRINKPILHTVAPRKAISQGCTLILLAPPSQEACRPFLGSHLTFFTFDLPAASGLSDAQQAISK